MERKEEQKKGSTGNRSRYLAVLLAGILIVCSAYFFLPDRKAGPAPAETKQSTETADAYSRTDQTTASARSETESTRGSSAHPDGEGSSSETETVPAASSEEEQTVPQGPIETYVEGEVVDSYYQYVNGYSWQDLYTLMILIGQSGVGINEGSQGKNASFSLFTFNHEFDPMLFVGFTDPATNISVMTLYITDNGYVYELLKVSNEQIYIDPEEGSICTASGTSFYRYSPHVLKKMEKKAGEIPEGFISLPVTDSTNLKVTVGNIASYLNDYGKGGQP